MDFQQMKVECKHLVGLLELIPVSKWKWEVISMDFIVGLPKTSKYHVAIMVMVNKSSKMAHFVEVKPTNSTSDVS